MQAPTETVFIHLLGDKILVLCTEKLKDCCVLLLIRVCGDLHAKNSPTRAKFC